MHIIILAQGWVIAADVDTQSQTFECLMTYVLDLQQCMEHSVGIEALGKDIGSQFLLKYLALIDGACINLPVPHPV